MTHQYLLRCCCRQVCHYDCYNVRPPSLLCAVSAVLGDAASLTTKQPCARPFRVAQLKNSCCPQVSSAGAQAKEALLKQCGMSPRLAITRPHSMFFLTNHKYDMCFASMQLACCFEQ